MKKTKRFIAAILSMGMVLAGSMTSFAAELPAQQSEEAVAIEGSARIVILPQYEDILLHVKGEGIRLRSEPGTASDLTILDLLYEERRDWVYLNGEAEIINGETWLRVTSSSVGKSGWIAAKYLYSY